MLLPAARGPLTTDLAAALRGDDPSAVPAPPPGVVEPLTDDDVQLALWMCFELHYRGFEDVADGWEWEPELLSLRRDLETGMLEALRSAVAVPVEPAPLPERLRRLVAADDGPPLARYLQRRGTREQFLEFVIQRSVYHLKEADPHTWGIPRLAGRAKAALVEIQADEYGGGNAARMHAELFRNTMRGLGLDDTYGRYVDAVPAITLAGNNLMSVFGLRRELRGALVGHLAAFEMTSSAPNRRYSQGLLRLGGDAATRRFYDEHVTADALHEQLALHDLCGSLAEDEPELAEDILFGAAAALYLGNLSAEQMLGCWHAHETSLRDGGAAAASPIADVS
jgi:Iron-containing redox enzyme